MNFPGHPRVSRNVWRPRTVREMQGEQIQVVGTTFTRNCHTYWTITLRENPTFTACCLSGPPAMEHLVPLLYPF